MLLVGLLCSDDVVCVAGPTGGGVSSFSAEPNHAESRSAAAAAVVWTYFEAVPPGRTSRRGHMEGGSGGGTTTAGGDADKKNFGEYLRERELGQFDIKLANVMFTEHCRQTNKLAIESLVESIRNTGWMPSALPQVLVPGVGPDETLNAETALQHEVHVLDGNHRLKAAKEFYKNMPDKTITCQCYRDIEDTFEKKLVADGERGERC